MDLKMMKINFEKDKNLIIDTQNSSSLFQRIKNEISENQNLENYKKIKLLKEELDWFIDNEAQILDFYKRKFIEAIKIFVIIYLKN